MKENVSLTSTGTEQVFDHIFIALDMNCHRIQAQLEHYAETYFNGIAHDLGERQLGHASSLDYDLEIFSASLGWIKTAVQATLKDQGMNIYRMPCPMPLQRAIIFHSRCRG